MVAIDFHSIFFPIMEANGYRQLSDDDRISILGWTVPLRFGKVIFLKWNYHD